MKHILTLATLVFATTCFGQVPDYMPTDGLYGGILSTAMRTMQVAMDTTQYPMALN